MEDGEKEGTNKEKDRKGNGDGESSEDDIVNEHENDLEISFISDIYQGDGGDTISEVSTKDDESDYPEIDTDNEGEGSDIESLADNGVNLEEDIGEELDEDDEEEQNIPVIISNIRRQPSHEARPMMVLRPVHILHQKAEASMALPTIAVTNFRSLEPKVENVKTDIIEREIDLLLGTETWHKESNKRLKSHVEKMFEENGLNFISCPRPSTKRGGGCAVIVNEKKFTAEKLPILVPHKLEVVWTLVRPKEGNKTARFKEIIAVCFYSPPNSRKNGKLIQHLISQMHQLLTKYPNAGYLCGGDKNQMGIQAVIDALPKCRQIVTKHTYKNRKTLDVIMTNMFQLYAQPHIVPAVPPDLPGHGVPSDHDMAVALPLAGAGVSAVSREYAEKTSRPMPDSAVRQFGQWITQEDWATLKSTNIPSEQAQKISIILQNQVDKYFPVKKVRVSNIDKPWITNDLKKMDRWRKEEYKRHGKSEKYLNLQKQYNNKMYSSSQQYLQQNVTDLMEAAPGRAWSVLKKMGAREGDCGEEGAFTMVEHLEQNLSVDESLEKMVTYFSELSCQHPPLNTDILPDRVKLKLLTPTVAADIPVISEYDVWQIQQGKHKTQSCVPGDLPARLRYEFQVKLSEPAALIFNNISQTGGWCKDWLQEYGTPLKKIPVPANEKDLRIISITNHFSLTQLAMRSLRPEHFSTSEVFPHTCGPTQTVAKYMPYRWSIQYLFVLRGENKMGYVLFNTIHNADYFIIKAVILAL